MLRWGYFSFNDAARQTSRFGAKSSIRMAISISMTDALSSQTRPML